MGRDARGVPRYKFIGRESFGNSLGLGGGERASSAFRKLSAVVEGTDVRGHLYSPMGESMSSFWPDSKRAKTLA